MSYNLNRIDLREIEERYLLEILKNITGERVGGISLTVLRGDASDRRYFRVGYKPQASDSDPESSSGQTPNSVIMMVLSNRQDGELPFINVQQHLKRCGVPVPEIYLYDKEKGFLFLEDCGDTTLEESLKGKDISAIKEYYKKAIDSLLTIQIKGSDRDIGDCIAFRLRFDVEKLMWEMNFMIEHAIFGLLDRRMDDGDLDMMREYLLDLCGILSNQKQYLNHRDYHSRNIMVKDGGLKFLDFQDARMGPCQYDLASLLRDSYTVLDDELVDELIEYYIGSKEKMEGEAIDRDEFGRIFDYMSIQRNLKAIGTFAYQKTVKGKERYMESIPPTLKYIRTNIDKYKEFSGLKGLLYKYLL